MNSTIQQQDTKVFDNQNFKNQESVMQTIQKYNEERTVTNTNNNNNQGNKKKKNEKCIIF